MKRQAKKLLILLAIVCACVGGYVGVRLGMEAKARKEAEAKENATVYVGALRDVAKLSYTAPDGTLLEFSHDADGWHFTPDANLPVDGETLDKLEDRLVGLKAIYSISLKDELSSYGFDTGRALTASDSIGNVLDIVIGKAASGENQRYIMLADGSAGYVVTEYLNTYSKNSLLDLADVHEFPKIDQSNLLSVSFTGEKFGTMLLEKTGTTEETYVWYLTLEGQERIKLNDFMPSLDVTSYSSVDKYVESIYNDDLKWIAMDSCWAYKPTAEQYAETGLDTPKYSIAVTYLDEEGAEQSFTLLVGDYYEIYDEDGMEISPTLLKRYVTLEGSDFICLLDEDDYERMEITWYEFNGHSVKEEPVGSETLN